MERTPSQILVCIGLCLFLAACSSGPEICEFRTEGVTLAPKKATSRPYQINGVWYYPQPYYEYVEEGIASFYGGGDVFHGRRTATGERFDMNGVTAAHKTLPLPCIAKITNCENGREVVVKVNDRGPFPPGRMVDVSRRVAQLLGFEHKGLTKVRVETLVPESLALNGIEPSTVMLAQAPTSPTTAPILPPAAPIVTSKLAAQNTLFKASKNTPSVEKKTPPPVAPVMMAEAPPPEPILVTETHSPVVLSEAVPTPSVEKPPSPLPVKSEAMASTGIFVYVGEYETYAKAQSASRSLDGLVDSPIGIIKNSGPQPYAARLGPLASMSTANQVLDNLVNTGHAISRIVIQR